MNDVYIYIYIQTVYNLPANTPPLSSSLEPFFFSCSLSVFCFLYRVVAELFLFGEPRPKLLGTPRITEDECADLIGHLGCQPFFLHHLLPYLASGGGGNHVFPQEDAIRAISDDQLLFPTFKRISISRSLGGTCIGTCQTQQIIQYKIHDVRGERGWTHTGRRQELNNNNNNNNNTLLNLGMRPRNQIDFAFGDAYLPICPRTISIHTTFTNRPSHGFW